MAIELVILGWAAVLLMVHIFAAIHIKTRHYGADWNMGARDEEVPPPSPLAARLDRAQANYLETLPVAIIALLGVVVADRASELSVIGGAIWLAARVVYLPLYAAGVPKIRTLVYGVSLVGLALALAPLLLP